MAKNPVAPLRIPVTNTYMPTFKTKMTSITQPVESIFLIRQFQITARGATFQISTFNKSA
jgi:hypothetical protein